MINPDPLIVQSVAAIVPQTDNVYSTDSHKISCVLSDIPSQVSVVKWVTDSNTANVYSAEDGTIVGTSQTSSLSLSSTQLTNLKRNGDITTFTCTIFVGDQKKAVSATQALTLFTPS